MTQKPITKSRDTTLGPIDTVYFHVTRACNLQCVYCYLEAGKAENCEITFKQARELFEDIIQLDPQRIVFTGGEPLIRTDFITLISTFNTIDKNHSVLRCINTNGTLITKEIAKNLVELFDDIRLSIDGFREIHDTLRGEGSFEKVMNAFRYIQQVGGDPAASVTTTSLALPSLKDFMSYLLQQGIFNIHLSPLHLAGRASNRKDLLCNKADVEKAAAEFWYETFGFRFQNDNPERTNCGIGKYINIYPDHGLKE